MLIFLTLQQNRSGNTGGKDGSGNTGDKDGSGNTGDKDGSGNTGGKDGIHSNQNEKGSKSILPETGQDNASTSLLGTLLAGIGSLLFFRRKKRNNE
ncbi:TPA: LPXTG cell wall anchor domain-containing protein [Staphylococcus aureus]|nr:LPXTG cell wall anchor domain-containing protein [Staphylococcus aureus]